MNRRTLNPQKLAILLAFVLLAINLCFLTWYVFIGYQTSFHSDSAMKVLLAREIIETGQYFPKDWNYVNKDLWVIFGQTFIIPLLVFLPAGYMVHAISGLISACLILSGIWLVTGLVTLSLPRRLLVVAAFASGISGWMAENLYGQISYGSFVYLSCYIIFFAHGFIYSEKKKLFGLGLFTLLTLAAWGNPTRAVIYYVIPLFAAIGWHALHTEDSGFNAKEYSITLLLLIIVIAVLAGGLLSFFIFTKTNNVIEVGTPRWLMFDDMLRNISLSLKGFFAIFGGLPVPNQFVMSGFGIYESMRLATALVLLWLMPYSFLRLTPKKQESSLFLSVFTLMGLGLALFFQFTTTIPTMSDPISSSRYLVPSLVLLTVLVLVQPISWKVAPASSFLTFFVLTIFATCSFPTYVLSNGHSYFDRGKLAQHQNPKKGLVDFLVANNLRYGYATYWNAGVISVISDEKLLVRQISVDRGLPVPRRHLSSNRWYRASAWQSESFLLLTQQEADQLDWSLMTSYIGEPIRELAYEDFKVFVFGSNIAKDLPAWDTRYESPSNFRAAQKSLRQTGRFVENYENSGPALVAERGETGALHFGPYVNVEPGSYTVTFDLLAEPNPAGSVRLDVAAATGQQLLGEKTLQSSEGPQTMTISLQKAETVEFRVWALGTGRVVFKDVSIVRIPS